MKQGEATHTGPGGRKHEPHETVLCVTPASSGLGVPCSTTTVLHPGRDYGPPPVVTANHRSGAQGKHRGGR